MGKFTEDEIAQSYAYYGVQLSGVEPKQIGPLEDVILAVIENPPPGRFITTIPPLIIKNEELNLHKLLKNIKEHKEYGPRLGYILDMTLECAKRLPVKERAHVTERIKEVLKHLKPSKQPEKWMPEKLGQLYEAKPKEEHEIKWNVVTSYGFKRFEDHFDSYVKYA